MADPLKGRRKCWRKFVAPWSSSERSGCQYFALLKLFSETAVKTYVSK